MTASDNTKKAEGLGSFFQNIVKDFCQNWQKNSN